MIKALKKKYVALDLYCGYAEETSLACLRVMWQKKEVFSSAKEMRDRFINDFVSAVNEVYPPKEPLSEATKEELKEKGYHDPSMNEEPVSATEAFSNLFNATLADSGDLYEELKGRGWVAGEEYKSGTYVVVENFDGYLAWIDNRHEKKEIPEWCGDITRTYEVRL